MSRYQIVVPGVALCILIQVLGCNKDKELPRDEFVQLAINIGCLSAKEGDAASIQNQTMEIFRSKGIDAASYAQMSVRFQTDPTVQQEIQRGIRSCMGLENPPEPPAALPGQPDVKKKGKEDGGVPLQQGTEATGGDGGTPRLDAVSPPSDQGARGPGDGGKASGEESSSEAGGGGHEHSSHGCAHGGKWSATVEGDMAGSLTLSAEEDGRCSGHLDVHVGEVGFQVPLQGRSHGCLVRLTGRAPEPPPGLKIQLSGILRKGSAAGTLLGRRGGETLKGSWKATRE